MITLEEGRYNGGGSGDVHGKGGVKGGIIVGVPGKDGRIRDT